MATDPEAEGGVAEEAAEGASPDEFGAEQEETPYFVEVWNDYDPSMRFAVIYPVGEKEGAVGSSVAYYIIEPGKHTGLHSDSAEEVMFVAEGEGEVFSIGKTRRLEAGNFLVFPAGVDHDIYAQGSDALRLLSFFPTTEVLSTFQQAIYPVGGTVLSSKPTQSQPVVTELDPNNLPADFPFDLADLGMAEPDPGAPRELTMTEKLIGMTDPGVPPPPIGPENVIDPKAPQPQAEDDPDSDKD